MAQQTLEETLAGVDRTLATHGTPGLTAAVATLAHALTALAQRVEMQNRILARVESHLAQEGRWTAAALTAAHLTQEVQRVQAAQDAKENERITRTAGRTAPPADPPVAGMLARLSSDLGRAEGTGAELPLRAVAIALDTTADFAALRDRLPNHAQHCTHTALSNCPPMLAWLSTAGRFARIYLGTSAADLLAEYDREAAS